MKTQYLGIQGRCFHGNSKGSGFHRNGIPRRRCTDCGKTFTPAGYERTSGVSRSTEKFLEQIKSLHSGGFSVATIVEQTGLANYTIRKIINRLIDPEHEAVCACGRFSDHKGWCWWRLQRSTSRQEFLKRWAIGRKRDPHYERAATGVVWRPSLEDHKLLSTVSCSEKGCIFPAIHPGQNGLCSRHAQIFSWTESLTDQSLEFQDLHDTEKGSAVLAVVRTWENDRPRLYTVRAGGKLEFESSKKDELDRIEPGSLSEMERQAAIAAILAEDVD